MHKSQSRKKFQLKIPFPSDDVDQQPLVRKDSLYINNNIWSIHILTVYIVSYLVKTNDDKSIKNVMIFYSWHKGTCISPKSTDSLE